MAATKITSLSAISTINTALDPLPIVDIDDTSQAGSGTTKKVTVDQIESAIFGATGSKAIVVDNVAALKALTVASVDDGQVFLTRGYYTDNDGGQGAYIYDAASSAADNGGTVIAPTSGSGRYRLQFDGQLNVKQFGAKADNTTDDSASFQAALNASVGIGRSIYIASGTYKIASTLNWPVEWPVDLFGDGVEATVLNYTGSSTAINMYYSGDSTKYVKSSIRNLSLVGNVSAVNGINIRQGYAIALRNLRIRNFLVGVRIERTWSAILDFVRIDACSQVGLELHTEANNIGCYGCEFLNNTRGIYAAGARSVLFSECNFEESSQYGAYITATTADTHSESIVFHSCYIEGNTTNDIRVILDSGATSPQSVIVRDCYFVAMSGKASFAIRVDQADHVVVDGCDFSVGTATYSYSLYISDSGTVSNVRFGKNRDASTNGVYRGTGTSYSSETSQESRAWGRFTISGGAIDTTNSFGVSGITRVSTGVYEVTLREAMPSSQYAVVASAENGAAYYGMLCSPGVPISTTQFRIQTASDASTLAEARTVNFAVFA